MDALIQRFGKSSAGVPRSEEESLTRVVEASKAFLENKYRNAILEACHGVIISVSNPDHTPVQIRRREVTKVAGQTCVRITKHCVEYLSIRNFVITTDALGKDQLTTTCMEPKPCRRTDGWSTFGALDAWLPHPREVGHRGIVLNVVLADGGCLSVVSRKCRQRSDVWHSNLPRTRKSAILRLKELSIHLLCGGHVQSNALLHACNPCLDDADKDLRNLFGFIEGLRDTYGEISEVYKELCQNLGFLPPEDPEGVRQFWVTCLPTKKPEFMMLIVKLNPQLVDGVMTVNAECRDMEDLGYKTYCVIIGALRIHQATKSRYQSLGETGRTMSAANTLGIDHVVDVIVAGGGAPAPCGHSASPQLP